MRPSRDSAVRQHTRRPAEIVIDFSPQDVKAPFILRCGAFLIDYILIVAAPVLSLLASRFFGNDGARLLNSELNSAGWIIAVLIAALDLAVLPSLTGQSLGKIAAGLRIVDAAGRQPSIKALLIRQTAGYALTAATLGLGFLIAAFTRSGRSLHDLLSGTVVIYGEKRPS